MRLKPTEMEHTYRLDDEGSGYLFNVRAVWDAEQGWTAYLSMEAFGLRTPEAAVKHLTLAAKEFLRQARAAGPGKDGAGAAGDTKKGDTP